MLHAERVAEIDNVLQDICHCLAAPVIGAGRVQVVVGRPGGLVVLVGFRICSLVRILAIWLGPFPAAHSSKIRHTTGAVTSSGTISVEFCQLAYLQVFPPHAAEILDDQGLHLAVLDHLHDLLPRRLVEVGPRVSVVGQKQGVVKSVISCISLEKELLGRDLSR